MVAYLSMCFSRKVSSKSRSAMNNTPGPSKIRVASRCVSRQPKLEKLDGQVLRPRPHRNHGQQTLASRAQPNHRKITRSLVHHQQQARLDTRIVRIEAQSFRLLPSPTPPSPPPTIHLPPPPPPPP